MLVNETQKITQEIRCVVNELRQCEDNQSRQTQMHWLSPLDFSLQQNVNFSRGQIGSGAWFLESHQLQQWIAKSRQTLFCPGIQGAGKTIMTSIVVHHLQSIFQDDPSFGVAYVYFDFRRQQEYEQEPRDLLASILKQLIQSQPSRAGLLESLYNRHQSQQSRPSLDELLSTLCYVLSSNHSTFILIDALDEYQAPRDREKLLQAVFYLQSKVGVNILGTSRYNEEIESKFTNSLRLDIRANEADIQLFLQDAIADFPLWVTQDPSLQAEIKRKISRAADGMYEISKVANGQFADIS